MADLRIEEYNVGDIGTNCYFIVNADTKEMVIIDPGGDGADQGAPDCCRSGQRSRRAAAGGKGNGSQIQPPGSGGRAGRGGSRRQYHQRTRPADGGAEEKSRRRRRKPGKAYHGYRGAG